MAIGACELSKLLKSACELKRAKAPRRKRAAP
jgi:hypothetical protein